MSEKKIEIPAYEDPDQDIEEFLKELEDIDTSIDSIKVLMDDPNDASSKNEPLARHTLLPVVVDLMKNQVKAGQFIMELLEEEKEDKGGVKSNVAYLSANIVSRVLSAIWGRMKTGRKERVERLQYLANQIEEVLAPQTLEVPLIIYDSIRSILEENMGDKKFREVAIAFISEQTGTSPEELMNHFKGLNNPVQDEKANKKEDENVKDENVKDENVKDENVKDEG